MIESLKKMFGQSGRFISIFAPFAGKVKPLDSLGDRVFAAGTLGPGLVIEPYGNENIVRAPVGGEVLLMSDMSHAVMIRTKGNAEVLIHVGMGTVELKGKFFKPLVQNGDFIKVGDPLLEFDHKAIVDAGYSIASPIVIPNLGEYTSFELKNPEEIMALDEVVKLIKD